MWHVEWAKQAQKKFNKLEDIIQDKILEFLENTLEKYAHPTQRGEPLSGDQSGLWRYRVGDYRIVCLIQDEKLMITVINVGHRRDIYQ